MCQHKDIQAWKVKQRRKKYNKEIINEQKRLFKVKSNIKEYYEQ